jgi:cation diffusion facilitator family transporter
MTSAVRGSVERKRRAARHSIVAGAFLTVLKLGAAWASGSLGMLAEAVHSALDLGAAVMTWVAVRTSWKPPDADHQYGHGKIENLAALLETGLLVLTSLWIVREALERLAGGGHGIRQAWMAVAVMAVSIVVDLFRARDLRRVAEETGSQALEADALHFSSDVASSSVVIIGVACAGAVRFGAPPLLAMADPAAAIAVAALVLVLSWRLGRRAVDVLLDRAPAGVTRAIETAVAGLPDVVGEPRVRVRQAGDTLFADVELPVGTGVPVARADRIAADARALVRRIAGDRSSVLVQLRPVRDVGASVRDRVAAAIDAEGVRAHDVTLRVDGSRSHADLHLELPGGMSLGEGHGVADRVEARILREVPEISRIDIHLEEGDAEPAPAVGLPAEARQEIERRVVETARGIVGDGRLHDLLVRRTPSGLYLSCHCFFPASTPLSIAHEVTDRLELALREAIPELHRVSVHAEPDDARD